MKIEFAPDFRTRQEYWSREECNKRASKCSFEGNLHAELRSQEPDLSWESEQIAKSHGIYLEFDRAKKGEKKDWMYMLRIAIPGGGPLSREQWLALDELSERYSSPPHGKASLRLTTRQNLQFHWLRKDGVIDIVRRLASLKMKSLNGAGDNTRNVTACPLSHYSDVFDGNAWAKRMADYFQLPIDPYLRVFDLEPGTFQQPADSFQYGAGLLNRKFKIAFGAIHRDAESGRLVPDNCTELRTNDVGISPVVTGENARVDKFQIYLGGGQGERSGKPAIAMLAQPLGIVQEPDLLRVLDAIVSLHQEWGDRKNRHWARIKYVVLKMGVDWFRSRLQERLGFAIDPPDPLRDCGSHLFHYGWSPLPITRRLAYGLFIENGRVEDGSPNGDIKTMMRELVQKYNPEIMLSTGQSLLLCNLPEGCREEFEADLCRLGYGSRSGKPFSVLRFRSGACVGLDTCRLAYTDSERLEPFLIDKLEALGWGHLAATIAISGCERQCSKPSTKVIGLVGAGLNLYQLRLLGTEDGRHQGKPIFSADGRTVLLQRVPRTRIAGLLDVIFHFYSPKQQEEETLGYCIRRIGVQPLIDHLSANPATADLLTQGTPSDDYLDVESIEHPGGFRP
jgi:sulfite reductase (NADPH) hemoprotein beta-component